MMKIGKQEYEMLKRLEGDWRWIARDFVGSDDDNLFLHPEKPYKDYRTEIWKTENNRFLPVDGHFFKSIQWEDREPYSITGLMEEYEREESEAKILESDYVVIEKPVIPQFVADYIEKCKGWNDDEEFYDEDNAIDLFGAMHPDNAGMSDKVHDYLVDNQETFARAWLDDYTVGEKLLYRARLKVITNEFIASYLRTQSSEAEDRLKTLEVGSKYIHGDYRRLSEFTEDELKRLDVWDSDQWEIEEVEENSQN